MDIEFLTTNEAAEVLGCTIQHVRLLMRQNKLDAKKVGRDWLITSQALRRYHSQTSESPSSHEEEESSMKSGNRLRMSPSVKECAIRILKEQKKPTHYVELTKRIQKLRPIAGATPENSVYSILLRGKEFRRVGTGLYALKGDRE